MSVAIRYCGIATRELILSGREPQWITNHKRASYVRAGYLAMPPWVDRGEMRWIHWCAKAWSIVTGIEQTLDHTIPMNHKRVCGLTVPANLRIVPRAVNANKCGHWCEHHEELFKGES